MSGPWSSPCRLCGERPLMPHLPDCPERVWRYRFLVGLTPAARRWRLRETLCCVRFGHRQRYGPTRCRRPATLWLVGPRGGIHAQWCAEHEGLGVRYFLQTPPPRRGELRDADYQLRSSDEELAMWAIANGPDVRPWYGPASYASTGDG